MTHLTEGANLKSISRHIYVRNSTLWWKFPLPTHSRQLTLVCTLKPGTSKPTCWFACGNFHCPHICWGSLLLHTQTCPVYASMKLFFHKKRNLHVLRPGITPGRALPCMDPQYVPVNSSPFLNFHFPDDPLFLLCWPILNSMTPFFQKSSPSWLTL